MSIIHHRVTGVGFGFLTPEELKNLSVLRITAPHVFDNLGKPVPGGLYDPALGPTEKFDTCITCLLPQKDCLGHMGHIELCVPVFHPLLFDLLFKLLRAKCLVCHRLRMSHIHVKKMITKLQLLDVGFLLMAKQVDELAIKYFDFKDDPTSNKRKSIGKSKSKDEEKRKMADEDDDDDDDNMNDVNDEEKMEAEEMKGNQRSAVNDVNKILDEWQQLAARTRRQQQKRGTVYRPTANDLAYHRDVIRSFFRDINKKCPHCQAFSPPLRRDGHTKIFKMPLTQQQERAMQLLGITYPDVLGSNANVDVLKQQQEKMAQVAASLLKKSAQKKKSKLSKIDEARQRSRTADDSDESEASDDENERRQKSIAPGMESDSDDDDGDKLQWQANKAAKAIDEPISTTRPKLMFPSEVEAHMRLLWEQQGELLKHLWGVLAYFPKLSVQLAQADYRVFFVREHRAPALPVPFCGMIYGSDILPPYSSHSTLAVPPSRFRPPTKFGDMQFDHPQNGYFKAIMDCDNRIRQVTIQKHSDQVELSNITPVNLNTVISSWLELQMNVNLLLDSTKGGEGAPMNPPNGIRQNFEKKEGLFRRNMMGKRVNFAARSVISPDPFIHTSEIGIPESFARSLTYPQPVTPYNVAELRQAVINGPDIHPGANFIEDERGNLINLKQRTYEQRVALSKTLLTSGLYDSHDPKQRGGRLNAIQHGGVKKVLRHLKSGDVMLVNRQPTLHKPSMMSHKARVMHGHQWQTIRMHYANCDTYNADFDGDEMNLHFPQNELARAEAYHIANTDNQYLVPTDGTPLRGLIQDHVISGVLLTMRDTMLTQDQYQQLIFSTCRDIDPTVPLPTPIPCILKPTPLWSGKQVISGILDLLTSGKPPLQLESKSKIPASAWGPKSEEGVVLIRQNELLMGVLDKSAFGASPYGLVHACFELYGGTMAGHLLSTLGRLFTIYLQTQGHTCGIDDMFIIPKADAQRTALIQESVVEGIKTAATYAGVKYHEKRILEINKSLQSKLRATGASAKLDTVMKNTLASYTSRIIQACLPGGQVKSFPDNCMSLMTISGAKGSQVNFSQISCLLGQQELEGKRVPLMASGKTLPAFRKYDPSPRAGGFISDRFLTGIRPQEFYFHCMAGREGLIDTAVKTSRSGYLQRCLVKHLESLVVNYDYTVRDQDGGIIQFHYGEDSIDVGKSSYLDRFSFLASNYKAMVHKLYPAGALQSLDLTAADAYVAAAEQSDTPMDPVLSVMNPGRYLGCVSDRFREGITEYVDTQLQKQLKHESGGAAVTKDKFVALMKLNYIASLVNPGESVGVLAAQSIGEPSTQMTLNTFHLAGHGGANVTLGIPRLREIIMTASDKLKTPIMELPLQAGLGRADADVIASRLNRLYLTEFLTSCTVSESMDASMGVGVRLYRVRLGFLDMSSELVKSNELKFRHFSDCFEIQFVMRLNGLVAKQLSIQSKERAAPTVVIGKKEKTNRFIKIPRNDGDGDDAITDTQRKKKEEVVGYDDADEEDREALAAVENIDPEMDGDVEDDKRDTSIPTPMATEDDDITYAKPTSSHDRIMSKCQYVRSISYDPDKTWAEVVVEVPLGAQKLLMMSLVETVVERCQLRSSPGIAKCFVVEKFATPNATVKEAIVQTDGVNFQEIFKYSHLIDVNRLASNDIAAILRTYGVEAARASIVREIQSVFKVYGISIDYRHLGLVADYMTFMGGFRPLNRAGIDTNTSPFQKISFETSIQFLMNACLHGSVDTMTSPSSRIVLGAPAACGTGKFDLLQPLVQRQK